MAWLEVKFTSALTKRLQYNQRGGREGDIEFTNVKDNDGFRTNVLGAEETFKPKGKNIILNIKQSFREKESLEHDPKFFNEIGQKLVEEYFPGATYHIKTHTNTKHTHNHIIVHNFNYETKRRYVLTKFEHLHKLRDVSDRLCLEHGLSVINKSRQERREQAPEVVKRVEKYFDSQTRDMLNKADFAMEWATNYTEYRDILGEFNINFDFNGKHIVYQYGEKGRKKRGRNLDSKYDRRGLNETFKENREKFQKSPELRQKLGEKLEYIKAHSERIVRAGSELHSARNESPTNRETIQKKNGRDGHSSYGLSGDADHVLRRTLLPISELSRAKGNVLDYCNLNKIALFQNDKGQTFLKGREYVEITSLECINHKNGNRGTLIDFVASHKNCSYLAAVAHINKNELLLSLEKEFGVKNHSYQSFYVPKQINETTEQRKGNFPQFVKALGGSFRVAEHLGENRQVQATSPKSFRLFPENDFSGAFEFSEERGQWTKKKKGIFLKPLFSLNTSKNKAVLFLSAESFIKHGKEALTKAKENDTGVIALMEPDPWLLDLFVIQNYSVKNLEIMTQTSGRPTDVEALFGAKLKARYEPFHIEVQTISMPKFGQSRHIGLSL
jgi:hypothetical protein